MTRANDAELTEMEGLLLAKVAQMAPITAYELKESIAAAPSRFWSGSAGAIYPAVKRLTARGMLTPQNASVGRRNAVAYDLSPAGKAAFRDWVTDLDRAVDPGVDPLRMRMLFLDLVPKTRRDSFLSRVEEKLQQQTTTSPFGSPETSNENRAHRLWMRARKSGFAAVRKLIDREPRSIRRE